MVDVGPAERSNVTVRQEDACRVERDGAPVRTVHSERNGTWPAKLRVAEHELDRALDRHDSAEPAANDPACREAIQDGLHAEVSGFRAPHRSRARDWHLGAVQPLEADGRPHDGPALRVECVYGKALRPAAIDDDRVGDVAGEAYGWSGWRRPFAGVCAEKNECDRQYAHAGRYGGWPPNGSRLSCGAGLQRSQPQFSLMAPFSAHTASPPPPSRTPAGSRASSREASIAPRQTSAPCHAARGAP